MRRALLILLALLWAAPASAQISNIQNAQGGTAGTAQTSITTANFGSSVTSGNLVVVVVRAGPSGSNISTITDTLGTSYAPTACNAGDGDPQMRIWSGVLASSGTNALTVTWTGSGAFRWVLAVEYAAGSGADWSVTPLDDCSAGQGTGVTDLTADDETLTTAQAAEVVVCGVSQGATVVTYTAGTDFTIIDGTIGGEGTNFGGAQDYITSGTLSTYTAHITSNSTAEYAMVCGAFKNTATGGGGGVPSAFSLIGVG